MFLPAPVLRGLEATAMAGRRVWLIRRYREKWQEMKSCKLVALAWAFLLQPQCLIC